MTINTASRNYQAGAIVGEVKSDLARIAETFRFEPMTLLTRDQLESLLANYLDSRGGDLYNVFSLRVSLTKDIGIDARVALELKLTKGRTEDVELFLSLYSDRALSVFTEPRP